MVQPTDTNRGKNSFLEKWFDRGIKFINDQYTEEGTPLTFNLFKQKYNIQINVMEYNSIISSLKEMSKIYQNTEKNTSVVLENPFIPVTLLTILKNAKGSRDM